MSCYVQGSCNVVGCGEDQMFNGYAPDGRKTYKSRCPTHHKAHFAAKKGLTSRDWENSFHPYLKDRKKYCENVDGRLGFTCTTTIAWEGMLDVDHKDGNPTNHSPENLQTLCKCCHAYKSNKEKDYLTPGRKALKGASSKNLSLFS